ncbi:MAG: BamA/TamA family outer membrane protein, partial [Candidatus Zixiibacteriota bacterium]
RYSFALRRHQKITRRTMLLLRGMLALSDGYLPMHKRYFLGGLGTLRGYNHKELMGTRFWMANVEYRFDLPTADFALSALWDVARIANDSPIDEGQIKHSFGFAAYVDDDLRISLAKRLDRSDNDDPKLYVRLEQTF